MKTKTVIVSDLHIDTWQTAAPFREFLAAIGPDTKTLYVNGDLMDMPPARGEDVCPAGSPAAEAMGALVEFARQEDAGLVYVVGNHDVGVSGLRINYDFQIPWMGGIAVTYPRVFIPTELGGIVVEHGHFYDPSLALFAGDLMLGTYYGEARTARAADITSGLIRKMQRRNPVTAEKTAAPGDMNPEAPPPAGCRSVGRNIIKAITSRTGNVADKFTPEMWRQAAQKALADYNAAAPAAERASTIVFGHTHIADRAEWAGGGQYFNTGAWTGGNMDYLEIDETGGITQKTWK